MPRASERHPSHSGRLVSIRKARSPSRLPVANRLHAGIDPGLDGIDLRNGAHLQGPSLGWPTRPSNAAQGMHGPAPATVEYATTRGAVQRCSASSLADALVEDL